MLFAGHSEGMKRCTKVQGGLLSKKQPSLVFKSKQFWQDDKRKKEGGSAGMKTVYSFSSP